MLGPTTSSRALSTHGKMMVDSKLSGLLAKAKTFQTTGTVVKMPLMLPPPAAAVASAGGHAMTAAIPAQQQQQQQQQPVPMDLTPLEMMQASVVAGSVSSNTTRIERRQPIMEAAARPIALEHKTRTDEANTRARQAWNAARKPVPLAGSSSASSEEDKQKDVDMVPIETSDTEPAIGTEKLVLSECADPKFKSRCSHELTVETYLGNGRVERQPLGYVMGCFIAATAEVLKLKIPSHMEAHIAEQSRSNVDRLQQPYHKAERKTRQGSKRKKPPTVSADTDVTTAAVVQNVPKPSAKQQKRKSKAGIGGRRAGNSTSKHRMKTFVRVLAQFPLTPRNSVHKGTTVPIDDMYDMRDMGVGAYHPLTFPAVQYRTPDPHGTVSAMESGELSVSSAPYEEEALILAMQQVILTTIQFGKPAILENFGAANITASAGLGWAIDLDKLASFISRHPLFKNITYDRSMFPGLHWRFTEPVGVVLGFFELGFVNAVGLKQEQHFRFVRDHILPQINQHREELENKQKSQSALPMKGDESDKEFKELCSHVDEQMERLVIHDGEAEIEAQLERLALHDGRAGPDPGPSLESQGVLANASLASRSPHRGPM